MVSNSGSRALGHAVFPDWLEDAPEPGGVVILYSTAPGDTPSPFDVQPLGGSPRSWVSCIAALGEV